MNTQEFKAKILQVIEDESYDLKDLLAILSPLDQYVDSEIFLTNLKQVVEVILEDRDGNNKFTLQDLKLIKDDIVGITSLVSGILLVINSIPQLKLKYDAGATEEIIFKVLAYVFLVVVPKETNRDWDLNDKGEILDITIAIYQLVVSSGMTKELLNNIVKWFKSKGLCKCLGSESKEDVVEHKMPLIKAQISTNVKNAKDKARIDNDIAELKEEINKLKNN